VRQCLVLRGHREGEGECEGGDGNALEKLDKKMQGSAVVHSKALVRPPMKARLTLTTLRRIRSLTVRYVERQVGLQHSKMPQSA